MKTLKNLLFFILLIPLHNNVFAEEPVAKKPSIFTPEQTEEIKQIIRNYIIGNPQILIEAGKKLQEKEQQERDNQITQIKNNIPKYKKQIFDTKAAGRSVSGNPTGKIIVAEFTQHLCPHCRGTTMMLNKFLKNNPDVQLIVIYWPFFGGDSIYTAKAVLAAEKQGKGNVLNEIFFASEIPVTKNKADELAKSVPSLDMQKFYNDIKDKKFDDGLKDNFNLARNLNLIGTPTLIFTNKDLTKFSLIPGQTMDFESDLVKALNEVRG